MAMDFWESQRRARRQTTIYLSLFTLITLVLAVAAEIVFQVVAKPDVRIPFVGPLFLLMTFGVAGFQYLMFKSGGSYVAESVGAQLVSEDTADPKEKQLLNIVSEMAIAASIPMPPVYVWEVEPINAFAAGTSPQNAAITVTRGSLNQLSRDELQGVVAHEFGHVHNADMVINMRLAAMVMGFFFILYIALRVLQFSGGGRSRDSKKGGNPVALIALILLIAGALAWLFGSILKAAVSRQREYLADASAVQFTRNSEGIAGALRKIEMAENTSMPKSGMAFSHMYFDSHAGLESIFATHPPLEKRIDAIEGKK
jgi:heat shock protein HtpX